MIENEQQLLELYRGLNGNRQHDLELGRRYGIHTTALDYFRTICGKVGEKPALIPDEVERKVVEMYEAGIPVKDIRREIYGEGHVGSIHHILRKHNVEPRRKPWTKFQLLRVIDLHDNKKLSFPKIAELLGGTKENMFWHYKLGKKRYGKKAV